MDSINMELRKEILEISLWIEALVNKLVTINLSVADATKSRSFNNKRGIPLQSKIDLLLDIETISTDEHSAIELIFYFRNKFLHLIIYNSFSELLEASDNGIKKRLKIHGKEDCFETEEDYHYAFKKLQLYVINLLNEKFEKRKEENDKISQLLLEASTDYLELQKNVKEYIKKMFSLIKDEFDKDTVPLEFQKALLIELKSFTEKTRLNNNLKIFDDKEFLKRIFR